MQQTPYRPGPSPGASGAGGATQSVCVAISAAYASAKRRRRRATPSSSQTRQYLLRNEALKWVAEVVDELKYQKTLADPAKRETEVASEYLDNLLKIFREYLKLAPEEELKLARAALVSQ